MSSSHRPNNAQSSECQSQSSLPHSTSELINIKIVRDLGSSYDVRVPATLLVSGLRTCDAKMMTDLGNRLDKAQFFDHQDQLLEETMTLEQVGIKNGDTVKSRSMTARRSTVSLTPVSSTNSSAPSGSSNGAQPMVAVGNRDLPQKVPVAASTSASLISPATVPRAALAPLNPTAVVPPSQASSKIGSSSAQQSAPDAKVQLQVTNVSRAAGFDHFKSFMVSRSKTAAVAPAPSRSTGSSIENNPVQKLQTGLVNKPVAQNSTASSAMPMAATQSSLSRAGLELASKTTAAEDVSSLREELKAIFEAHDIPSGEQGTAILEEEVTGTKKAVASSKEKMSQASADPNAMRTLEKKLQKATAKLQELLRAVAITQDLAKLESAAASLSFQREKLNSLLHELELLDASELSECLATAQREAESARSNNRAKKETEERVRAKLALEAIELHKQLQSPNQVQVSLPVSLSGGQEKAGELKLVQIPQLPGTEAQPNTATSVSSKPVLARINSRPTYTRAPSMKSQPVIGNQVSDSKPKGSSSSASGASSTDTQGSGSKVDIDELVAWFTAPDSSQLLADLLALVPPASDMSDSEADQAALLKHAAYKWSWAQTQPESADLIAVQMCCMLKVMRALPSLIEAWKRMQKSPQMPTFLMGKAAFEPLLERLRLKLAAQGLQISMVGFMQELDSKLSMQNWNEADRVAQALLKALQPFDCYEFMQLMYQQNVSLRNLPANLLDEVTLVIGSTGSGKSTTIHFFAGSEFAWKTNARRRDLVPIATSNPYLASVKAGGGGASVTRFIAPVPVEYTKPGEHSSTRVVLVDTPGFGDSQGAEVDITNGNGIIEAIQRSKAVRLLFVCRPNEADRCKNLKEVLEVLLRMLPSLPDNLNCARVLITPATGWNNISPAGTVELAHNDCINSNKGQAMQSLTQHLLDLLDKDGDSGRRHVVDPDPDLKDREAERVRLLQLGSSAQPLLNPSKHFKFFISKDTKSTLQYHQRVLSDLIQKALESGDIALVRAKLLEYCALQLTRQAEVSSGFSEYLIKVRDGLHAKFQDAQLVLETNGPLGDAELKRVAQTMHHLQLIDAIRTMLPDDIPQPQGLLLLLEKRVKPLLSGLISSAQSAEEVLQQLSLPDIQTADDARIIHSKLKPLRISEVTRALDQLQSLEKASTSRGEEDALGELASLYGTAKQYVLQYAQTIARCAQTSLSLDRLYFELLAADLQSLSELTVAAGSQLQPHFPDNPVQQLYDALCAGVSQVISHLVNQAFTLPPLPGTTASIEALSEANLQQIASCKSVLSQAASCPQLLLHGKLDGVISSFDAKLREMVDRRFDETNKQLTLKLKSSSLPTFSQDELDLVYILLLDLMRLSTFPSLRNDLPTSFQSQRYEVQERFRLLREKALQEFRTQQQEKEPNFKPLSLLIAGLPDGSFEGLLDVAYYSDARNVVKQEVCDVAKALCARLLALNIEIANPSACDDAIRLHKQASSLLELNGAINELKELLAPCEVILQQKLQHFRKSISDVVSNPNAASGLKLRLVQHALLICDKFTASAFDMAASRKLLSERVQQHASLRKKQASDALVTLLSPAAKDAAAAEAIRYLQSELNELEELQSSSPELASILNVTDSLADLGQQLLKLLQEIDTREQQTQNAILANGNQGTEDHEQALKLLSTLAVLDRYLPKDADRTFSACHKLALDRQASATSGALGAVMASLNHLDFDGAMTAFVLLQASKDASSAFAIEQSRKSFSRAINQLLSNAQSKLAIISAPIRFSKVEELYDAVQKLKAAEAVCGSEIESSTKDAASQFLAVTPQAPITLVALNMTSQSISLLGELLRNEQLLTAANDLAELRQSCERIMPFCTPQVQASSADAAKIVSASIEKLMQAVTERDVTSWLQDSPMLLVQKLNDVAQAHAEYATYRNTLLEKLQKKVHEQIMLAANVDQQQAQHCLSIAESALALLPEQFQATLKGEVQSARDSLERGHTKVLAECEEVARSLDGARILSTIMTLNTDPSKKGALSALLDHLQQELLAAVTDADTKAASIAGDATVADARCEQLLKQVSKLQELSGSLNKIAGLDNLTDSCNHAVEALVRAFERSCTELSRLSLQAKTESNSKLMLSHFAFASSAGRRALPYKNLPLTDLTANADEMHKCIFEMISKSANAFNSLFSTTFDTFNADQVRDAMEGALCMKAFDQALKQYVAVSATASSDQAVLGKPELFQQLVMSSQQQHHTLEYMEKKATEFIEQLIGETNQVLQACDPSKNASKQAFEDDHKRLATNMRTLSLTHQALVKLVPRLQQNDLQRIQNSLQQQADILLKQAVAAQKLINPEAADNDKEQKKHYQLLSFSRSFLSSLCTHVDFPQVSSVTASLSRLENELLASADVLLSKCEKEASDNMLSSSVVSRLLVAVAQLARNLGWLSNRLMAKVDDCIGRCFAIKSDENQLNMLYVELQESEGGCEIAARSKWFHRLRIASRNIAVQGQSLDVVLKSDKLYTVHGATSTPARIPAGSGKFANSCMLVQGEYNQLLEKHLLTKDTSALESQLTTFVKKARDGLNLYGQKVSAPSSVSSGSTKLWWTPAMVDHVPYILAHLFAIWSIELSKDVVGSGSSGSISKEQANFILKPHPPQIIAIMRLLGIGDGETLENHLCQVGTGEGKSVVLAMVSAILALLGANVYVGCYSAYLSSRDSEAFRWLFEKLHVSEQIYYGSFNDVCEKWINAKCDIRTTVAEVLLQKSKQDAVGASGHTWSSSGDRPSVLLIDEVDVFFSSDFYGSIYTPMVELKHDSITQLIQDVWECGRVIDGVTQKISLKKWLKRPSFIDCQTTFPHLASQLQESLKDLLASVSDFQNPPYSVVSSVGKIGYLENGSVSTNTRFGHKTMFAALQERDNCKLTSGQAEKYLSLNLHAGHFSYAELPYQFDFILGVSGTLETLSTSERRIVQDIYKIKKMTCIPSAFGNNNLDFSKLISTTTNLAVADGICLAIRKGLLPQHNSRVERAVMVFFEDFEALKVFERSNEFKQEPFGKEHSYHILSEETPVSMQTTIMKQCTSPGSVTLLTKSYGRGTDFIVSHPEMKKNGGIHVVIAFLPESQAEETQLKGRTARMSGQGSAEILVTEGQLEKVQVSPAEIETQDKLGPRVLFQFIGDKRNAAYDRKYSDREKQIEAAKKEHEGSLKFLAALRKVAESTLTPELEAELCAFLLAHNKGPAITSQGHSRTLVCFDATGSMSSLLEQAKITIGQTFERAFAVLKEHKLDPECFSLQLCAYRNYNVSPQMILQHTPFETRAPELRSWLSTISVAGGIGEEAIELALWHAAETFEQLSSEDKADKCAQQVIIIGDAPSNSKSDVHLKRQTFSCYGDWNRQKFSHVERWEDQLNRLIALGCPVHTFWLAAWARPNFQLIAEKSHGECHELLMHTSESAAKLTDLLTRSILTGVGGENQELKDNLVKTYNKLFIRAHV